MAGIVDSEPRPRNLSTEEFVDLLKGPGFEKSGFWQALPVDFDDSAFLRSIATSPFQIVDSTDEGAISIVKEASGYHERDFSRKSGFFGLHTDGMYYPEVPELGILYCVNAGKGSFPTVFVDTRQLVGTISECIGAEKLQELDMVYTRKTNIEYTRPLLEMHPYTGEFVMNIGLTPQCRLVPGKGINMTQEEANALYRQLVQLAEDNLTIVHTWSDNDLVMFDNAVYVHGRGLPNSQSLDGDSERELKRIWLTRKLLPQHGLQTASNRS